MVDILGVNEGSLSSLFSILSYMAGCVPYKSYCSMADCCNGSHISGFEVQSPWEETYYCSVSLSVPSVCPPACLCQGKLGTCVWSWPSSGFLSFFFLMCLCSKEPTESISVSFCQNRPTSFVFFLKDILTRFLLLHMQHCTYIAVFWLLLANEKLTGYVKVLYQGQLYPLATGG